jgi:precorrin-8X/cobalt-precorrin-8 methylmutase
MKTGMKPEEIERLSFEIIDDEAGSHDFSREEWGIVRRMIHTSADFEFLQSIRFHPDAIQRGISAIQQGNTIITDTLMAKAGIRSKDLSLFGASVQCFITSPQVEEIARTQGTTRARAAVDAAVPLMEGGIYVVGNAPTALLRLIELIRDKRAEPVLVVGLPVGFVNAAESKAALIEMGYPFISNVGRKGGSNLAAAVINALIKLAVKGDCAP